VAKQLDAVIAAIKATKKPLRSEDIQTATKLDKRALPRVLQDGVTAKKLTRKGVRRSTTYAVA
jgi:hypothetical protein